MVDFKSAGMAATLFLFAAWPQAGAHAQTHEKAFEKHVLRSSVVSSMSIPEASAAEHNIKRAPDLGILNVTVLKQGSQLTETVPADVKAYAMDLSGARRLIPLRETKANGWVSYTGTFPFAPREVLDFTVSAQPENVGQPLEMTYREQLWRDGKTR